MRERYRTVSLPEELTKKIVEVINSKRYGYASISEFVKECIRNKLRELGYIS